MDIKDIEKVHLEPDDILLVEAPDDTDSQTIYDLRDSIEKSLYSMGIKNRVIVSAGGLKFKKISTSDAKNIDDSTDPISTKCDCGGTKTGTGHSNWCSINVP